MTLNDRIKEQLAARPDEPQSVMQLSAAITEASCASVASACVLMRMQGIPGRNGAGTAASPFRFYMKRKT